MGVCVKEREIVCGFGCVKDDRYWILSSNVGLWTFVFRTRSYRLDRFPTARPFPVMGKLDGRTNHTCAKLIDLLWRTGSAGEWSGTPRMFSLELVFRKWCEHRYCNHLFIIFLLLEITMMHSACVCFWKRCLQSTPRVARHRLPTGATASSGCP